MTDWPMVIADLPGDQEIRAGVTTADLRAAGEALGAPLPIELQSLLSFSDGITGDYCLGLVWPLARIVRDNLSFRNDAIFAEIYMPFDALLFFGDAGNGDQFGVRARIDTPDVYVWNHENDSRTWVAGDIRSHLQWWTSGRTRI